MQRGGDALTTPHRHPSDATMAAFVAGAMPAPHAVLIARHLKYCAECRATRSGLEHVAAGLIAALEPATLRPGMEADVMARLDQPIIEGFQSRQIIDANMDYRSTRTRRILPGIRLGRVLRTADNPPASLYYLEMEAGTSFPRHRHGGPELLLVFEGGFIDTDGAAYGPGDVADIEHAEIHHAPKALPGGTLRGWIAMTGRYRFDGLVPRLAQPFIGI